TTFPQIFFPPTLVIPESSYRESTGFDAIVGNPPYGAELNITEKKYLVNLYKTSVGNGNTYVMFLEKSIKYLRKNGISGLLTPTTFLTGDNFTMLRKCLLNSDILSIIKLPYNTFKDAYIDTCIIITQKNEFNKIVKVANIPPKEKLSDANQIFSFLKSINKKIWLESKKNEFIINEITNLIRNKIFANNIINLEDIATIDRGTLPPKKYIRDIIDGSKHYYWFSGQIYRYNYVKELLNVINIDDLKEFKNSTMFQGERILIRQLISRQFRINASIVNDNFAFKKNLYCVYLINNKYPAKYLLGLTNSKLFSYYIYNSISGMQKNDFPSLSLKDARCLPIKQIDFQNKTEKQSHDKIISLVEQMLESKKQLQLTKTDKDKTYYERKCETLDKQIDSEVYKLYGLTEEEIKIVEGKDNGN
ncbi:MAG TPA: N-6 DNA methylase, partial [Ignavibacteria bacterium]